jgi:hypothetical protein
MYKQYLKVEDTKNGKGTFTTVPIPPNSMIVEMTGPIVLDRNLPADSLAYLQVGPNSYMGPSGGETPEFLNHSCDPNCKVHIVGNRAFLYSLYLIPANNQLTFDYSTTSTETLDMWQMQCKCGTFKCRKVISGASYLSQEQLHNYQTKGMLPLYVTDPGILQKK